MGRFIVVDLGCADVDGDQIQSIPELVMLYKPDHIYGFDIRAEDYDGEVDGVPVTVRRLAAWTCDGSITYVDRGASTTVNAGTAIARCFDFPAWLRDTVCEGDRVIVKMDIETSEYRLLKRMHQDGTDALVELFLIEWHGEPLNIPLRAPIEEWWN